MMPSGHAFNYSPRRRIPVWRFKRRLFYIRRRMIDAEKTRAAVDSIRRELYESGGVRRRIEALECGCRSWEYRLDDRFISGGYTSLCISHYLGDPR